jgi:hypothetical protein
MPHGAPFLYESNENTMKKSFSGKKWLKVLLPKAWRSV